MVKERLDFNQGTDVYRAYEALTRLGYSFASLDSGCSRVSYSSQSAAATSGSGDKVLKTCEVWNKFSDQSSGLSSTVRSLFGEAETWALPTKSSDKSLQAQLQSIDNEIKRLRKVHHGAQDEDLKVAKGLYQFLVSPTGLAISSVDDISENSASEILIQNRANCSEYFSIFRAVFNRAGLTVNPVFVFESATGDKKAHVASAFQYGGKTYLMDSFYNGFDTPHRRWALLSLREFWAWHFNNEGLMAEKAGKIAQAEKHFQRAADLDPDNPWIPNNLGQVLAGTGRKDEAKAAFQKSISVDGQFIEPYISLGALYLNASKWKEALVPLTQGYAIQSNEGRILYNLASAHFGLGEYQKSLGFIQKAILLNSNIADYFIFRADVFSKLNRSQEAQKDRAEAQRLQNNSSSDD